MLEPRFAMEDIQVLKLTQSRTFPGSSGTSAARPSSQLGPQSHWLRWSLIAVLLATLGVASYLGYNYYTASKTPVTTPQTVKVTTGTITSAVSSTGTVATQNTAKLSFPTATSSVTEVLVKVGDSVTKGQALAKLDASSLRLAVTQAEAALAAAQTKLDTVKAGAVQSDVAAAQVAVTTAQSNLDTVKAGATAAELSAAQQSVAAAWAQVLTTRNSLATLQKGASALDVKIAQLAVTQAQVSYNQAVADRNTTCADTSTTQKANACSQAKLKVTSAYYAISSAQNALTKLKTPASAADLATAKAAVTAAENSYNSAVAKLNELKAEPTSADLAAAQAQLAAAQTNLDKAQNPYSDADLQAANVAVAQAQAALDTAKQNLAEATLAAPFDGVVSAVAINVGDTPSSPAVTLVDAKDLKIDLSVDESDISSIKAGQKVTISTDDESGKSWQGTVYSVSPTATIQSGVALYTVSVNITDGTGLVQGMTGSASIVTEEHQNVLVVPNKAIQTQGRNTVVQVLVNGQTETKVVQVGMSNESTTEITSGIAEGDQVIVNGTTTSTTTTTTTTSQSTKSNSTSTSTFGATGVLTGGAPTGGPAGGPPQ